MMTGVKGTPHKLVLMDVIICGLPPEHTVLLSSTAKGQIRHQSP